MKLIDLLVKELPKRGGWPLNISYIAQDEGCATWGFLHKPEMDSDDEWMDDSEAGYEIKIGCIGDADDCNTSVVSKQQYEAALAKNDGWIEWGGSWNPPVHENIEIQVKHRDGRVETGIAGDWRWYLDNSGGDIIAYRLHKQDLNSRANDDRLEQDLNECIGQSMIAEKSEAEFPEVGAEIEYSNYGQKVWYRGIVTAIGESMYIVKNLSGAEQAFHKFDVEFRPLRTEAEKLREAAIDAMTKRENMGEHWMARVQAVATYEAIAAGKIPGIKLDK